MEFKRSTISLLLSAYLGEGETMQLIHPGDSREISLKTILENYYRFYLDKAPEADMTGYGMINNQSALKTIVINFYKPFTAGGIPRRKFSKDFNKFPGLGVDVMIEETDDFSSTTSPQIPTNINIIETGAGDETGNNLGSSTPLQQVAHIPVNMFGGKEAGNDLASPSQQIPHPGTDLIGVSRPEEEKDDLASSIPTQQVPQPEVNVIKAGDTKETSSSLPIQPERDIPRPELTGIDELSNDFPQAPPRQVPRIQANLMVGDTVLKSAEISEENPVLLYDAFAETDEYKLLVINKHPTEILEDLIIDINYLTPFPVLTKIIPLKFFQNAFDSIWNDKDLRYINFRVEDEKLYLKYDPEFVEVYPGLSDKVIDKSIPIIDFDVEKIDFRFDMESVRNIETNTYEPTIVWTISFNQGKIDILGNAIDISKLPIVFEYKLNMRNTRLYFTVKCKFLDDIFEYAAINDTANDIISALTFDKVNVNNFLHNLRQSIYDAFNPLPDNIGTLLYYWFMGRYDYTEVYGVHSDNENMYIYYVDYLIPQNIDHSPILTLDGSSEPGSSHSFPVSMPHIPVVYPPNSEKVDHVVFVMLENRSYDQMLGYLNLRSTPVIIRSSITGAVDGSSFEVNEDYIDGLNGGEYNEDVHHDNEKYYVHHITNTKIVNGPGHETENMVNQMAFENEIPTMGGFINDYRSRLQNYFATINPSGVASEEQIREDLGQVMGYYTEAEVPVFDYLANHFAICKRWFSAHPGPTLTNRFITLTGDLLNQEGQIFENHPSFVDFLPIQAKTIFDYLSDAGVSWNYFERQYCTLRLFGKYTFDEANILDIDKFHEMALNGTLPQVSFIDPDYIDLPPGNDDHPPADIRRGQRFIGEIVASLQDSPVWEKTLLIITYDENGGFYDHVPPPKDTTLSSGRDFYGPRVPAFVISPYIPAEEGRVTVFPTEDVDNNVYDHTSAVATILRKFCAGNIPSLGNRTKQAKDVWHLLSLAEPRSVTKISNIPAIDSTRKKYEFDKLDDKDGFHHLVLSHGLFFRG